MLRSFYFINLLICSVISISPLCAKEELIVIKSVSKTKQTFAIRRGYKDGIRQGQKSLFSTDKASISARVTGITRFYSTWKMEEKDAAIPFKKGQIVNYTNSLERIWTRIGMLKYLKQKNELEFKRLKKTNHFSRFIISLSFSNAFSDNVKEIEDYEPLKRQSYSIEGNYSRKINEVYEVGAGLRYDNETATKEDPDISLPTTRYFMQGFLLKNFAMDAITFNRFYIGTSLGIGKSSTNVVEEIKSGNTFLFPTFKLGRKFNSLADYSFFLEFNLERITSSETFSEGNTQTTTIMASRLNLGMAF